MPGAYIAVEGYTLSITNSTPGVTVFGTPSETHTVSLKAKADGKKVLASGITYVFSPSSSCVFAAHTFVSGAGSISATAVKGKSDGNHVLRDGDVGNCIGSFTNNSSGATVPCACTLKIGGAGQSKVKSS